MTQPYFYIIGWRKLNKWYAGIRFAKGCNPGDLWVSYFTSSNRVKAFREQHGDPDYKRTWEMADTKSAIDYEVKFLSKRYKLDKWLNQNCAGAINMTDELKAKISQINKDRGIRPPSRKGLICGPLDADRRKKISDGVKLNHPKPWSGRKHSPESIALMKEKQKIAGQRRRAAGFKQSEATIASRTAKNTGKKRTPEQIERMRAAQRKRRECELTKS